MKILKEGHIPMPPPLWPIDFGFECYRCHCKFAFEEGDTVKQDTDSEPFGKSTITLPCPYCSVSLQAVRPLFTGGLLGLRGFQPTTPGERLA